MVSCQKEESFFGYKQIDLDFDGFTGKLVFPEKAAPGNPWIWRARFWGHEPSVDTALLKKGYHLAYVDVTDLFGNRQAMARFDSLYLKVTRAYSLHPKVVLEGMSRGGLPVYNWSSLHPEKVACLYLDAPVCDLRSWPGGMGEGVGNEDSWQKCLKAHNTTGDTILENSFMPINTAKYVAEAKIPVIHACGDADTIVPLNENTMVLKTLFDSLNAPFELLIKKGKGHDHKLENPKVVIGFIEKNYLP